MCLINDDFNLRISVANIYILRIYFDLWEIYRNLPTLFNIFMMIYENLNYNLMEILMRINLLLFEVLFIEFNGCHEKRLGENS